MLTPRFIMVGGFLGAGKTTAILQIAQRLHHRDARVGLITNDQSTGLVDTTMLAQHGFPTEEITGGCFCCKFNSLVEAAQRLSANLVPEVLIAEPVGSCTDLVATVSYPLRKMYGDNYVIAPLSVLVDPIRAQRIVGLRHGKTFAPKVVYIYEKQLEEAEIIVVNKTDLLSPSEVDELEAALAERYQPSAVLQMSARAGDGVDPWLRTILQSEAKSDHSMEIDYDLYAEGEAELGWLNLSTTVEGNEFDGNRFVTQLGTSLGTALNERGFEVAHLKMTLAPSHGNDLAAGNLMRPDATFELSHRLAEPLETGELLVNLRAAGDPEQLAQVASDVLKSLCRSIRLNVAIDHLDAFRPARPTPTHRLAGA